jgi:AAA15 family ATPase/GTPase
LLHTTCEKDPAARQECLSFPHVSVVRCCFWGPKLIQFPIIRRLHIVGYQLFENENSQEISHVFRRGVHAVVGINGLGKTTFLTMLYRALLGPFDQSKSDEAGLLGSQHELSAWRSKGYFRDRVRDGAKGATIELDVEFGKKVLTLRRRLSTLQLEILSLDGTELDTSNETYEATINELAGTATIGPDYSCALP